MTLFCALPQQRQLLLAGGLFLAALCELVLCMYRYVSTRSLRACADSGGCFLVLLLLVSLTTAGETALHIPWLLFPLLCALILAHAAFGFVRGYRWQKNSLSPASVKQALDELNSGVCFADGTGRIILMNRVMRELAFALTGGWPQTGGELAHALEQPRENSGVRRIETESQMLRFPDGRVWRFYSVEAEQPELKGFTQTVARDVTKLYEITERLQEENEALRETNVKTRRMYDRLADRIREQETLHLKMRIHNDIGTSLIAISELMRGDKRESMDEQLRILQNAVSYFGGSGFAPVGTWDDACRRAEEMKVELVLDGTLPQGEEAREIAIAAARECVTNCVNHAGGSRVLFQAASHAGVYTATVTNDGAPPEGEITEGGGLSALRKRIEQAGGEMQLVCSPRFALILKLPEEGNT